MPGGVIVQGFDESDLDREFNFAGLAMLRVRCSASPWLHVAQSTRAPLTSVALYLQGFYGDTATTTLRAIIQKLERAYCGNIGYEYMHINECVATLHRRCCGCGLRSSHGVLLRATASCQP